MRSRVFVAFVAVGMLLFVAIGASAASPQRVAYIINGGLGDLSFYDSGQAGIDRIRDEFGVQTRTIECGFDPARYAQALQAAIQWNADVMFVISYGFEDLLQQYADQYPNKYWINVDTVVENSRRTITSVDFIEEEGAFLAGVAAALVTTDTSLKGVNPDKIIGAVGGDDDPVIRAFLDTRAGREARGSRDRGQSGVRGHVGRPCARQASRKAAVRAGLTWCSR